MTISSLIVAKLPFVIPEPSKTRYQESQLSFVFNPMLINLRKRETLANVALLIEA